MNNIKRIVLPLFLLLFAACGDDNGGTAASDSDWVRLQVDTFDELPNCSKNREGNLVEVLDIRQAYRCLNGVWEYDHAVLDSVLTEDDLPVCKSGRLGEMMFVRNEHAPYECDGRRWTKIEKDTTEAGPKEYENEDDLPSCSESREGNVALIDGEAYLCHESRWRNRGNYYATEDDLTNCTAKRDGEKVYIADINESYVCDDGVWIEK